MLYKKQDLNNDLRKKRLKAGLSLREFCKLNKLDPSNYSKMERDLLDIDYDLYIKFKY